MTATKLRRPLNLPPAIRANYEKRLTLCRQAWEATQDPLAVAEAITLTHHYRQPIEPWIEEAAVNALVRVRSKAVSKRHREDVAHLQRWTCVRDLNAQGMTWEQAKEATVDILKKLGQDITVDTVWASYRQVQRDIREHRNGRYWHLKDKRYRHLEHLG